MTVVDLINELENFGGHLKVVVDVYDNDQYLVVDTVDTIELEGETVVSITVSPDVT